MTRRPRAVLVLVLALAVACASCAAVLVPSPAQGADVSLVGTVPVQVSASDLDAYLAGKGSPMAGQGAAFLASGTRWQVDPRLVVAIAGAESSFGAITCAPFNGWGWGCPNGPYEFTSWADGIDAVSKGLRTGYLAEGRTTVALVNQKYAPIGAANDPTGLNNHWTVNVSRFLSELGGDPNDIDTFGIAGTTMIGPAPAADPAAEFGFSEEPSDGGEGAPDGDEPGMRVSTGKPRPLVIDVRNTGSTAWDVTNVRLRRVDVEPRIVGDPFGVLVDAARVEPGASARFVVLLAARAEAQGQVVTRWRLEGPSGPFGPELERAIGFDVPALVLGESRADATQADDGTTTVLLRIRNAGSATWRRDGDARVLLGVRARVGSPLEPVGWTNRDVVGPMLERSAAPGEIATFAFRVHGADGGLVVAPFTADGWAHGTPATVVVGTLDPAVDEQLRTAAGRLAS